MLASVNGSTISEAVSLPTHNEAGGRLSDADLLLTHSKLYIESIFDAHDDAGSEKGVYLTVIIMASADDPHPYDGSDLLFNIDETTLKTLMGIFLVPWWAFGWSPS